MEFYIGDRVRATNDFFNKKALGKTGAVVAVDNSDIHRPYLVDFEDFQGGYDGSPHYDKPWFPEEAKKPGIQSCRWMSLIELELVSRAEDGKRKKTTEEETAAASTDSRQCANDAASSAPPPPPPIHDLKVRNTLTQLCAEQEGVTDIFAFQRAGCHKARELYKNIGGLLLELDGYGRRAYQNLPGLSTAYCNLLTEMMMGKHWSSVTLRAAVEDATQNAKQEHENAKEDAAKTKPEDAKIRASQSAREEKLETLFNR